MASISMPGNDGQLVINNLPLNKVDSVTSTAESMIKSGSANSEILSKVSQYQTQKDVDVAASVTKTVGRKAKSKKAAKAKAPAKAAKSVGKRAKGANNAKRTRALVMFGQMTKDGYSQEFQLKAVMDDLQITYANAYYYYSRVFKKA